jgi:predicted transcriptional regulator
MAEDSQQKSELSSRRFAGELEAAVLAALWTSDTAMTPGQVRDALGDDLAYTTVMTTLVRLHEKGQVARERVGRAYAYQPAIDVTVAAADKMRHVMEGSGDREGVLAKFIGDLDQEDGKLLRKLLGGRRPRTTNG